MIILCKIIQNEEYEIVFIRLIKILNQIEIIRVITNNIFLLVRIKKILASGYPLLLE